MNHDFLWEDALFLDGCLIRPFAGLRPRSEYAAAVAAPPYDVLSSEEARRVAAARPYSFLHVSKAEIDLPPEIDPYAPQVYAQSAVNFQRLVEAGVLQRDARECYYIYRLQMGEHVQTGLVAAASVTAYERCFIRKHEFTRPDKEDDRVRQIEALNAQTGPVLLAHPAFPAAEALVMAAAAGSPVTDVTASDGIRHTVWMVDDPAMIGRIGATFGAMPSLYIADGHHRSAAAARVAAARRGLKTGTDKAEYFLTVIFPATQMRILDYNRVVRDLNGLCPDEFLAALGQHFSLCLQGSRFQPEKPGVFGMYLGGQWYRLEIDRAHVAETDPIRQLDVSLLSDGLLDPILGIKDLRRDTRIDFVGGIRGLAELERRVDCGEMAVAFSLHPTPMAALMAVADAGEVMPPKSTWFEPKLADGLVSYLLD